MPVLQIPFFILNLLWQYSQKHVFLGFCVERTVGSSRNNLFEIKQRRNQGVSEQCVDRACLLQSIRASFPFDFHFYRGNHILSERHSTVSCLIKGSSCFTLNSLSCDQAKCFCEKSGNSCSVETIRIQCFCRPLPILTRHRCAREV